MKTRIFSFMARGIPTAFLFYTHSFAIFSIFDTFFERHTMLFPVGIFELTTNFYNRLPSLVCFLGDISFPMYLVGCISLVFKITNSFKCCIGAFVLLPLFVADVAILTYMLVGRDKICASLVVAILAEMLLLISIVMRIALVFHNKKPSSRTD